MSLRKKSWTQSGHTFTVHQMLQLLIPIQPKVLNVHSRPYCQEWTLDFIILYVQYIAFVAHQYIFHANEMEKTTVARIAQM